MSKAMKLSAFAVTMFAASGIFSAFTPGAWVAGMAVITAAVGAVSLFFLLIELTE